MNTNKQMLFWFVFFFFNFLKNICRSSSIEIHQNEYIGDNTSNLDYVHTELSNDKFEDYKALFLTKKKSIFGFYKKNKKNKFIIFVTIKLLTLTIVLILLYFTGVIEFTNIGKQERIFDASKTIVPSGTFSTASATQPSTTTDPMITYNYEVKVITENPIATAAQPSATTENPIEAQEKKKELKQKIQILYDLMDLDSITFILKNCGKRTPKEFIEASSLNWVQQNLLSIIDEAAKKPYAKHTVTATC